MRALFFALLFANLAYLAWAGWVDVPQPVPTNEIYARLPRLKLVGEQAAPTPPAPAPPAPKTSSSAPSDLAKKTALAEPQSQVSRCASIGPFASESEASEAAAKLRDKGLSPRQRSEAGEVAKGFWVYIGGLKSDREVAQVLRVLEQSHVDDAHAMPPGSSEDRRVSVGLFSERERADRRAQSLRKLDLQPEVAPRTVPGTVYWVDVDAPPGAVASALGALVPAGTGAAGAAGPAVGPAAMPAIGSASIQAVSCPGSTQPAAAPLGPAPASTSFRTKVATGTPKMP